jgi:hypothetical protein
MNGIEGQFIMGRISICYALIASNHQILAFHTRLS